MAIEPIEDSYIDDVIKSTSTSPAHAGKTQGYRLRELIKKLRDRFEQQIASSYTANIETISVPPGAANIYVIEWNASMKQKHGDYADFTVWQRIGATNNFELKQVPVVMVGDSNKKPLQYELTLEGVETLIHLKGSTLNNGVSSVIPPAPTNPVTDDANNTFTFSRTEVPSASPAPDAPVNPIIDDTNNTFTFTKTQAA